MYTSINRNLYQFMLAIKILLIKMLISEEYYQSDIYMRNFIVDGFYPNQEMEKNTFLKDYLIVSNQNFLPIRPRNFIVNR